MIDISKEEIQAFKEDFNKITSAISTAVVGQRDIIRDITAAIISGGNVLLEGMPGLGKTQLIKTAAKALSLDFSRIQFTPDLMPSDITGTDILIRSENGENTFKFSKGPIFSNIILADEINRATPKTQSALLEAMQEKTVTAGTTTYKLPEPFFVLATQNPLELEGTYPLPEAQLDRFMLKLNVGFPTAEELISIVGLSEEKKQAVQPVFDGARLIRLKAIAESVPISEAVARFAVNIVAGTHPELEGASSSTIKYLRFGSSPRGAQAIIALGKIYALLNDRYNVSFDDIALAAYPTLRHRVFLNFDAMSEGKTPDEIISLILKEIER